MICGFSDGSGCGCCGSARRWWLWLMWVCVDVGLLSGSGFEFGGVTMVDLVVAI